MVATNDGGDSPEGPMLGVGEEEGRGGGVVTPSTGIHTLQGVGSNSAGYRCT